MDQVQTLLYSYHSFCYVCRFRERARDFNGSPSGMPIHWFETGVLFHDFESIIISFEILL